MSHKMVRPFIVNVSVLGAVHVPLGDVATCSIIVKNTFL